MKKLNKSSFIYLAELGNRDVYYQNIGGSGSRQSVYLACKEGGFLGILQKYLTVGRFEMTPSECLHLTLAGDNHEWIGTEADDGAVLYRAATGGGLRLAKGMIQLLDSNGKCMLSASSSGGVFSKVIAAFADEKTPMLTPELAIGGQQPQSLNAYGIQLVDWLMWRSVCELVLFWARHRQNG